MAPTLGAQIAARILPGTAIVADKIVEGDDFRGNPHWYQIDGSQQAASALTPFKNGNAAQNPLFVWAGGLEFVDAIAPAISPATSTNTQQRPDGTIKPLDVTGLQSVFGTFNYTEGTSGSIQIDSAWIHSNIVAYSHAAVNKNRPFDVHQKAKAYFDFVFNEIQAQGLQDGILEFGGCWVPRHICHDPAKALSSHSWGVAVDLNVSWNGYGRQPAPAGSIGSVLELVPIFNKYGFAWGGHFGGKSIDPMHFELALLHIP